MAPQIPRAGDRPGTSYGAEPQILRLKGKAKETIDPNNSDIIRVSQRHVDNSVRLHIIQNARAETPMQTSPYHHGHIDRSASLPNGFFLMIVLYVRTPDSGCLLRRGYKQPA